MKKITKKFMKLSITGLVLIIGIVAKESQVRAESTYKDNQEVASVQQDINSWMPDKTLQFAVSQSLFKPAPEITKADMSNLSTLSFDYVQKNTQVDLTGLELATNLKTFDSSNIIAINIPQISIGTNGILDTRPNVLKHIIPKGLFNAVRIREDTSLSTSDLIGIGHDLEGWEIYSLSIFTESMRDYSKLDLPPEIMENSYVQITNRKVSRIKPIEIKDNVSQLLYSDENVKDTEGNLLLASVGNFGRKFNLTAYDKSGVPTRLSDFIDYSYTADGIKFNSIPNDTDYIELRQPIPMFLAASRDYRKVNYDLIFQIPVKYLYSAKDVTVTYLDTKGNSEGVFSDQPQTVKYIYSKNPIKAENVVVKYIDTKGNSIPGSTNSVLTGYIGEKYKSEQKTFDGYTFVSIEGNSEGEFSDQPQTVKYIYSKNPIKAQNVIVKYIDSKGKEIHENNIISGNIGDSYDATSINYKIDIDGYSLNKEHLPSNSKGTLTDKEQIVIYVYNKKNSNIGSSFSELNTISLNSNSIVTVQDSDYQSNSLPRTGDEERMSNVLFKLGALVLVLILLLQIVGMKSREHN